jgi:hypothetical protein
MALVGYFPWARPRVAELPEINKIKNTIHICFFIVPSFGNPKIPDQADRHHAMATHGFKLTDIRGREAVFIYHRLPNDG